MESQTKMCQNCKKNFILTPQDIGLLEKMRLPAPSFCAHCAMVDRMLWRNDHVLYKHPNNFPNASGELVSIYSPQSDVTVYDSKSWWGDGWDAFSYGKEYDFSRSFFEQFSELVRAVPFPALQNWNAVNSDYCNCTSDNKNCYLVFGGDFNEDSMYSMYNIHCKNVCDVYWLDASEFCYEVVEGDKCYRVKYAMHVRECSDSSFLYDCVNCTNCTGCVGLRSASNRILNQQYSREEYQKKVFELALDTFSGREAFRKEFEKLKASMPIRFAYLMKSHNVTGDRITNSKDCINCFDIAGPAENLKDSYNSGYNAKDMLRSSHAGYGVELIYNSFGVFSSAQNVIASAYVPSSMNVLYSYNCPSGANLFGCVGLKKGNYCIFNKQYSKEEYQELVPKIIEQMKAMPYTNTRGRVYSYGDFFPGELSIFAYNESVAQDMQPLSESEIIQQGYVFNDRQKGSYNTTISAADLPQQVQENFDEWKSQIIECSNKGQPIYCSNAFRLTVEEFQFYKRMEIPLPRFCYNCRHNTRFDTIRSMVLHTAQCDCGGVYSKSGEYQNTAKHQHGDTACEQVFQTVHSKEENKILYCATCYQSEVM